MNLFASEQLRRARIAGESVVLGEIAEPVLDEERFAHILDQGAAGHLDLIRAGLSEPLDDITVPLLQRLADQCASLRVRRIHVLDQRIRDAALQAHRELAEEINVNAYWSAPRTDMGLAPHVDGYDIVVVQVAGAKRWTLYTQDPHTFTLRQGEALFLPRGLRHQACNPHDAASLHLAFGVYGKTTRSLVEWVAEEMSTPAGDLAADRTSDEIAALRSRIDELLAAPDALERFRAHRSGVEYERMLMTPSEHARSDARRFR